MDKRVKEIDISRDKGGVRESVRDLVVQERPLTIYLNQREIVTLLCTPEYLEELAVGFLVSEGFIKDKSELQKITVDYDMGTADVRTSSSSAIAEITFLKRFITTGCGKGTSFYHLMDSRKSKVPDTSLRISSAEVLSLMRQAQHSSDLFLKTGGVHSTALGTAEKIIIFREDIGRHNATDKILGKCFLEDIPLDDKILLTTGRISSEILIKAAKMGIGILVSRSAPTSLAVDIARETGVTIIGFARGNRFNIYTHPQRVSLL